MNKPTRVMLNDQTAKCLTEGATAFMIPWKEQPGIVPGIGQVLDGSDNAADWVKHPPYKLGNPLYLLETYDPEWRQGCEKTSYASCEKITIYKADYSQKELKRLGGTAKWRSPATMPNKACRYVWPDWTVEAVEFESWILQKCEDIELLATLETLGFTDWGKCRNYFTETFNLPLDSWAWLITKGG